MDFLERLCHSTKSFCFSNMLKIYIFFSFSAGGPHDWGILLIISLEFQEIKHQPFSMTRFQVVSSIVYNILKLLNCFSNYKKIVSIISNSYISNDDMSQKVIEKVNISFHPVFLLAESKAKVFAGYSLELQGKNMALSQYMVVLFYQYTENTCFFSSFPAGGLCGWGILLVISLEY